MATSARVISLSDAKQRPAKLSTKDYERELRKLQTKLVHLLKTIPWKPIPYDPPKLPKRQKPKGYQQPAWNYRWTPERF